MVTLEELEALDLVIWLRTTDQAARLACANQSTISRRNRAVQQLLGIGMERGLDGWRPTGDTRLLDLQRRVHQQARFLGRQLLRLHVPCWTRRVVLRQLPGGWCANPSSTDWACENPVQLLRERVIDACLLTPTQIPPSSADLLLLDLYARPIELTVFPGGAARTIATPGANPPTLPPSSGLELRLLPFLPRSCRERSSDWFEALRQDDHERLLSAWPAAASLAFLTPEMRELQERPWRLDQDFEPFPYVERLAVLAENAHEPAVQQLKNQLLEQFAPLAVA